MSKDPIVVDVDYYGEDEIRQLLARKQSLVDYAATAADEIERLREELAQARREAERLREALRQIYGFRENNMPRQFVIARMREIARAALEVKP